MQMDFATERWRRSRGGGGASEDGGDRKSLPECLTSKRDCSLGGDWRSGQGCCLPVMMMLPLSPAEAAAATLGQQLHTHT